MNSKKEFIQQFVDEFELSFDIDKFNIESFDEPFFTSVFITFKENWAFRMFFVMKTYTSDEYENIELKIYNLPVYNFSKKKMAKMTQEEIFTLRERFITFVLFTEQFKLNKEIEKIEQKINDIYSMARSPILKGLK